MRSSRMASIAGSTRGAALLFGLLLAFLLLTKPSGSWLLLVLFWSGLFEGAVALCAAAELSNGKWIRPVRSGLLSLYPLILVPALIFLFFSRGLELYPWYQTPTRWLRPDLFVARNIVLYVLSFITGASFARSSLMGDRAAKKRAVIYLVVFVTAHTIRAIDLVMSLEYPWYSTLLGGYTFVEAVYSALALAALMSALSGSNEARGTLWDAATMMFGFSLFWAGLFYAQFLVIWYGDLPEEAGFVIKRIYQEPWSYASKAVLAFLFLVPFVLFLSHAVKRSRLVVGGVAFLVLSGMVLEKAVLIAPDLSVVPLSAGAGFLIVALMAATRLLFHAGR